MNFRKNSEILKIINNDHRSQNKYPKIKIVAVFRFTLKNQVEL